MRWFADQDQETQQAYGRAIMSGHSVLLLLLSPQTAQIKHPCPDCNHDLKLFKNTSMVNYGAWLYTAFALPLIYLVNSGTPILKRGHSGCVDPGVASEHLVEY